MPTDTKLDKLVINKLTLEQYQSIEEIADGELYFVENEADGFPAQLSGYAGYALLADGTGGTYWGEFPSLDASHTWTGAQTFNSINVDTINSKATGNSLLRMYYDTDGAYKCLVGSVYRQTTLLGSTDRPYYAKDGETFQAHELALKEDILHHHVITFSWSDSTHLFFGCFTGLSKVATALTSYDDMHNAFNGKAFTMSGVITTSGSNGYVYKVSFTGGTAQTDNVEFIIPDVGTPSYVAFSAMSGFTITDVVD